MKLVERRSTATMINTEKLYTNTLRILKLFQQINFNLYLFVKKLCLKTYEIISKQILF